MDARETKKEIGLKVQAVCYAKVRAFAGTGNVTAIVQGESGECRLYGVSLLVKVGLLPITKQGRFIVPDVLAALLGCKVVLRGADALRQHLAAHKLKGIDPACVLGDAPPLKSTVSAADLRKF